MSRARARTNGSNQAAADVDNLLGENSAADLTEAPPTSEQLIAQFFGEDHSDDVSCSIYEVDGKERGYLFGFNFGATTTRELFDGLLETNGPGTYELQAQRPNGQLVARKVFRLGSTRQRKQLPFAAREAEKKAEPAQSSGVSPELAAILENQNRMLERMIDLAQPAQSSSPFDAVRDLLQLKELFAQPQTPISEVMGIVNDVLKLKDRIADDDPDRSPFDLALKTLGPQLSRLLEQNGGGAPAAAPAQPQAQSSAPRPPLNPNPDATPTGAGVFAMLNLDSLFAELAKLAEKNLTAEQGAEAVLQWLAEQREWIEQAVLGIICDEPTEKVVGRLVGSAPALAPHRAWLASVVGVIKTAIENATADQDETPEQAPTPAPNGKAPADADRAP